MWKVENGVLNLSEYRKPEIRSRWRVFCTLLLVFSLSFFSSVFAFTPTDVTEITLVTCTPGDELYSVFGHSGIRIHDEEQGIDVVFNYGTFDFTKPNFYTNFLRGILIYSLSVENFRNFRSQYLYENRGVSEQVLNLSLSEKQEISDFLIQNAQPENRDYRYDFLLDNCATRIRDVFERATNGSLHYNTHGFDSLRSFRKMIDEYSWHKRWENFGMNLLIGLPVDRPTSYREQMFLPDYMRDAFQSATIRNSEPFVLEVREIIPAPHVNKSAKLTDPEYVFAALLIVVFLLTLVEIFFGFHLKFIDFTVLWASGLLGCLFLALWLFTQHWTTHWNLNLLWALPTNLILAQLLLLKNPFPKLRHVVFVMLLIAVLFVAFHALLPQPFQTGMMLISLLLTIRLFRIYYVFR